MLRPPPRSTLFPYTTSSDLAHTISFGYTARHDPVRRALHLYQEHRRCRDLDRSVEGDRVWMTCTCGRDRKSTRLNSSHLGISYDVFCSKKTIKTPTLL